MLVPATLTAVTDVLSDRDIAAALSIANGSEATRALFHARYRIAVDDPVIEHLEIISEFRRFVLAAEDQLKAGNWMMARGGFDPKGRTLKDLLRPLEGQLSIRVRLRFHPQNNYVALPAFDILLGEPTLLALNAVRVPRTDARNRRTGKPRRHQRRDDRGLLQRADDRRSRIAGEVASRRQGARAHERRFLSSGVDVQATTERRSLDRRRSTGVS